jgi:hypothetical protein
MVILVLLCPVYAAHAQEKRASEAAAQAQTDMAMVSSPENEAAGGGGGAVRVWLIVGTIICLFGLFSGHDWTLFAFRTADLQNPEYYSRYAKFSVTFLSAVLIWVAGEYAFDPLDARRLAVAFSFIVLGDIIFFFNVHSIWGVFSFALAHFLLIRRNAFGLAAWPERGAMWALLAAILGGSLAVMFLVFYPKLKNNRPYFSLLTGYAIVIGASVWAALIAVKIGYFPEKNALLIALGALFFFLSDVCVGFYRSLPKNYTMVFATYLTWVFYAPALVLTALSGYSLDRTF